MSLNGYSWVEGNSPNMVDPSGEIIERGDVENGRIVYSCGCGWIDWDHANPIHGLNLLKTVEHGFNPQTYTSPNSCGVKFQTTMDTWTGYQMQTGSMELYGSPRLSNLLPWYYIPKNSTGTTLGTAARIFRDLVKTFEENESSSWNPIARDSGYSVEDLPSYLIGFVLAVRMEYSGYSDTFYDAPDKQTILRTTVASRFLSDCNILDSTHSLAIYDELGYGDWSQQPKNRDFYPIFGDSNRSATLKAECSNQSPNKFLFYVATTGVEETVSLQEPANVTCSPKNNLPYPNTPDGPIPVYECQSC